MMHVPLPPLLERVRRSGAWLAQGGIDLREPVVTHLADPEMVLDGQRVVSFGSNNYLGLSRRPEVLAAGQRAVAEHSMGTCESRRLGGNLALLEELERRLAAFCQAEAAMVFATGLLANVAVLPGVLDAGRWGQRFFGMPGAGKVPVVFSDALNHRSIQMGLRLAHVKVVRYPHGDVKALARLLDKHRKRPGLIVTDTLFSMDGDLAPLSELAALARAHDAVLMTDEAHATGVFGRHGRGVAEHFGVMDRVHLHMGTLSKALGGLGGFVAGPEAVIRVLKFSASGYRFTSSLPAEQAAGLLAALDLLEGEPSLRAALWRNIHDLLAGAMARGIPITRQWSPILPVILPDEAAARRAEASLLAAGFYCPAAFAPLTATPRLRLTVNATHTPEHIQGLLAALARLGLSVDLGSGAEWEGFLARMPSYVHELRAVHP